MTYRGGLNNKRTVLLVDDAPENLLVLNEALRHEFRVKLANSGERALEITASDEPPDIVLLDIDMPGMDGHEVLRRLRADAVTREIPVIFVTAKDRIEDELTGFDLGAVDYIVKPISQPVVLVRVKAQLALSERAQLLKDLSHKLSRYLPPQLYVELFEGARDTSIATQRRMLTVFFSDIVDFTATAEALDPMTLTRQLNTYFTEMTAIALDHGATIDKFIGDAMLAFFGDPRSRGAKEDALQCVRMAVAMQRRMAKLRQTWGEQGYLRPFRIRVGINTGLCNVGNFGSPVRMDYTVIGAEVNLAARLEHAADPDGIMISAQTYELVSGEFEAEIRAPIAVKGIARPVRPFVLKGI